MRAAIGGWLLAIGRYGGQEWLLPLPKAPETDHEEQGVGG